MRRAIPRRLSRSPPFSSPAFAPCLVGELSSKGVNHQFAQFEAKPLG